MPTVELEWSEAKIQRWFIKECRGYGWFVAKVKSLSFSGFPDVVVASASRIPTFVELKTKRGRLSKVQHRHITEMKNAGMDVRVYYGKADAERFFREAIRLA